MDERDPGPDVGQEWAYRLRGTSPSERVLVLAAWQEGRKQRVSIRHLDGDDAGREEEVPRGRLCVPWAGAEKYDLLMAGLERLREDSIDRAEERSLWAVVSVFVSEDVAELYACSIDEALLLHDRTGIELLMDQPLSKIQEEGVWIEYDGEPCFSPSTSLRIAESICRKNPQPILDRVMTEEAQARTKSKHGGKTEDGETRKEIPTSPEEEYARYLRWEKPTHEILQQWCGYRAVTAHERLLAAEAENHRLDELLGRTVEIIRGTNEHLADGIDDEHENERVTPYSIRPVPQRPLQPNEIPVIRVPDRRRWWN